MTVVITYGTFDLFHKGHLKLLQRARALGDRLVVGVSSDEFNAMKGKNSVYSYAERSEIVKALKCVDDVFPEHNWEQKTDDIVRFQASILVMGDDWQGKFDSFNSLCEVRYLPRTEGISTTDLKKVVRVLNPDSIAQIESALKTAYQIITKVS